jgi:hypothetical protein
VDACVHLILKNKNQKIFCSVAVKINFVRGRYATVGPSARPYPLPLPAKTNMQSVCAN